MKLTFSEMKKILLIYASAMMVLCAVSCNKDKTDDADIVGNWSISSNDFYYDGSLIEFNKLELGIVCLMEDNSTKEFYDPMSGGLGSMITYNFSNDGCLYVMGMKVAEWEYSGGELIIRNPETGESGSLGSVSDGHIYIENDSATVLGYQFREMFNYDPITNWLGYDGNLHEIRYVTTLSK